MVTHIHTILMCHTILQWRPPISLQAYSILPLGAKKRLAGVNDILPFCHCPLPGSLAILNWLIAEIPALRQCSVRRATAEKIILIRATELIMCNTVSSFHHKFTTLQQVWMEPKASFAACLRQHISSRLQSNLQLRIARARKIRPL